jgi:hypothetical protein
VCGRPEKESLTFAACGNSPQSQSISRLFFCMGLSVDLLTNSESLFGVDGRDPEGLKKTQIHNLCEKRIVFVPDGEFSGSNNPEKKH